MLRHVIHSNGTCRHLVRHSARLYSIRGTGAGEVDDEEVKAARQWLAKLDADTIRQNAICDISFSRSSGPGGQNVNKYLIEQHASIPQDG
jgi:hypothetical protein